MSKKGCVAGTTISERLFESLCYHREIPCQRIPTAKHSTPDYEIVLGAKRVFVEVKQLDPNADDIQHNQALATIPNNVIGPVDCPAPRVREQIARAYRQLKTAARNGEPCLLVIYNNSGPLNYIDEFTVTTAMFGRYGVRFGLARTGYIREIGRGFMGDAKLTRNTCKALSAVGILEGRQSGVLSLDVYHNPFALTPIELAIIAPLATSQFRHPNPHTGNFVSWEPAQIENN